MIRKTSVDFPFKNRTKEVWYILIDWENQTSQDYCTVVEKNNLVNALRQIIEKKHESRFELHGIWHGAYSTDVFVIPTREAYNNLKTEFNSANT